MTEERMICEKSHREINHPEHGEITEIWWCPVEPAPPKDWVQKIAMLKQQVIELEDVNRNLANRNAQLSQFIMDKFGEELDDYLTDMFQAQKCKED